MKITVLRTSLIVSLLLSALPSVGTAATLDWSITPYTLYSNQEQLSDVITGLAISEGIPVEISDSVSDVISANFENMTRGEIFDQLVSAYGLAWYFDGHRLYIDRLENTRTATIRLKSMGVAAFRRHLVSLGVLNEEYQNGWKSIDHKGIIYVSGPAPFVERVSQMAVALDDRYRASHTIYKWVDSKGITHFSMDASEAPHTTEIIEVHTGGMTTLPYETETAAPGGGNAVDAGSSGELKLTQEESKAFSSR